MAQANTKPPLDEGHIGTAALSRKPTHGIAKPALSKKPAPAVAAFTAKLIAAGKKRS